MNVFLVQAAIVGITGDYFTLCFKTYENAIEGVNKWKRIRMNEEEIITIRDDFGHELNAMVTDIKALWLCDKQGECDAQIDLTLIIAQYENRKMQKLTTDPTLRAQQAVSGLHKA